MTPEQKLDPIKFGTDGWRAVIADQYTFANVERVSQAYASFIRQQPADVSKNSKLVVVGYDRRFLSEHFAQRAAEVLTANELEVILFEEAVPTPLVSWVVRDQGAAGGVMITASHNPATFNGFKIKAPWGGSASPETTRRVEGLVDKSPVRRIAKFAGGGKKLVDQSIENYRQQIHRCLDLDRLKKSDGSVIIDPMHGSAGTWVESFLKGGTLKVETIRADRDPLFGGVNPEPIDQNIAPLKARVVETRSLMGLATDGDADRLGVVDENGNTLTMHDVVPILIVHLARMRKKSGGIVRTFSQSVLLKRIANGLGLKLYQTPVGFKYIADLMLKEDILLGAEESGGVGVKDHIPERDGVLNCLLFLEACVMSGKPPSQLLRDIHNEFGEFHFRRRDIHMDVERGIALVSQLGSNPPSEISGFRVSGVDTMDGTKLLFEDESWLLFRQSGTEPALRVYAEATSIEKTSSLLEFGQQAAAAK